MPCRCRYAVSTCVFASESTCVCASLYVHLACMRLSPCVRVCACEFFVTGWSFARSHHVHVDVYVCMCAYMYVCVRVRVRVFRCTYVRVCMHVSVCVDVGVHVCMNTSSCMCAYAYVYVHVPLYSRMRVCMRVCVSMRMCMCVCFHKTETHGNTWQKDSHAHVSYVTLFCRVVIFWMLDLKWGHKVKYIFVECRTRCMAS